MTPFFFLVQSGALKHWKESGGIVPVAGVMAEEEKVVRYFSRDFEWEELRDEVEQNPKYSYHLSPFSPSLSSPPPVGDAWRSFHRLHSTGMFFKERRYLLKEFPELIASDDSILVLEVGCGNGSTALPILRAKQNIIVYACDCSQDALDKAGEIVAASNLPSIQHHFYPFLHDFFMNKFPDWLLCSACQSCSVKEKFFFMPDDASGKCLIELNMPSFLEAKCCIGGMDYVTLLELEYCCVVSVNHRSGKKMRRVWIHGKFQKPFVGA